MEPIQKKGIYDDWTDSTDEDQVGTTDRSINDHPEHSMIDLCVPLTLVSIFHARLPQKVHFTKQPTKTRQEMSSDAAATSVTSAMRSALSPANLSEAGAFAKERTAEFQRNLHDGSWSLRFLALLGALAMMTIAVLGFLHDVRE